MTESLGRKMRLCGLLLAGILLGARASAAPDLSGPWQIALPGGALHTANGETPPLLPAAAAKYRSVRADLRLNPKSDPAKRCLPPGVPRLMMQAYPFNLVQGVRTIAMVFEWNHLTRVIYMDRDHFDTIGPLYLGQSVGHWEGDVLVVDTDSFNDITWLDDTGLPHSDQLHTVEHIRLTEGGNALQDRITIDDPETYRRSWDAVLTFQRKPGVLINEDYCLGRS